jgi:hypothetical protein
MAFVPGGSTMSYVDAFLWKVGRPRSIAAPDDRARGTKRLRDEHAK